jgi:mono/diheme cytochrome c family protein
MGPLLSHPGVRVALVACAVAGAVLGLSACSAQQGSNPDVVAGKVLFVQKCGACHTLARAGTKGNVGPNLDQAFQQSIKDGLKRSGVEGAVHGWILHPNAYSPMPAKVVTGQDAQDVAAYVAQSVAAPGKDTGLLATAVKPAGAGKPAVEKDGTLQIDADPNGQTAFVTNKATATPGQITVKMANKSSVDHDIVIDGKGRGQVVSNGGVSQFSADFGAGTYTYYCSVDGHRAAGMQGQLTVK